jgi:hypothetical protein
VSSTTLLDEGGSPIDAPRNTTFLGSLQKTKSSIDELTARRKFSIRDIDNPAAPKGSNPGGVFTVSSDGDYLLHEGSDFIRKLIFRRLMTTKGGFYHLPNYGVGLRVKEPLPAGDLISLQKEIKDQIEQEPEITQSRVIVTQSAGALTLVIRARLEPTGQQISFPLNIPFAVNL